MSFLPEDYKMPKTGGDYMKFEQGANKFRIVSDAITGFVYWTVEEGKRTPIRVETYDHVPPKYKAKGEDKAKHFWSFAVYNYNTNLVQVLEITQATIQASIAMLTANADWGEPKEYDITVNRKGEGMETEYSVIPSPKKALTDDVVQLVEQTPINLKALFKGESPFSISVDPEDLDIDKLLKS